MTIKTFWTILLKILGLWFMFYSLTAFAQLLSLLFMATQNVGPLGIEKILLLIGVVLLASCFNIFVLWVLLFKTAGVIEKLKLTNEFTEERFELNMEWSTVLTIAIIVIGGVIFIDSFPLLCKQLLSYVQRGKYFMDSQESIWILYYLVKTVLGYLLMTNSKFVVHFIGRQNVKNENSKADNLSPEA